MPKVGEILDVKETINYIVVTIQGNFGVEVVVKRKPDKMTEIPQKKVVE